MKNNLLKSLMITGAVLSVIGCGGGSTLNEEGVAVNTAPVAVPTADPVSVNINTDLNVTITLDGSTSTDADGDTITAYTWSLTAPTGSAAVLSSTTGVSPTFDVDIIGSYIAGLVVNDGNDNSVATTVTITVTDSEVPLSTLTPELKEAIAHMYNEEGLAYDVYMKVYNELNVSDGVIVPQLYKIAMNSETKHIAEVNTLAIRYDLNITDYPDLPAPYSVEGIGDGNYSIELIKDLYTQLTDKGVVDKKNALEVGCIVEVVDIDDLDIYIGYAEDSNASDILEAFKILRNGSYNHYWTFNDALIKMKGSTDLRDGCCSVTDELSNPNTGLNYNWCHIDDYPPSTNGN
ncbi:DUF2202 domain-containing protein [Campylobacterota bacterium]